MNDVRELDPATGLKADLAGPVKIYLDGQDDAWIEVIKEEDDLFFAPDAKPVESFGDSLIARAICETIMGKLCTTFGSVYAVDTMAFAVKPKGDPTGPVDGAPGLETIFKDGKPARVFKSMAEERRFNILMAEKAAKSKN